MKTAVWSARIVYICYLYRQAPLAHFRCGLWASGRLRRTRCLATCQRQCSRRVLTPSVAKHRQWPSVPPSAVPRWVPVPRRVLWKEWPRRQLSPGGTRWYWKEWPRCQRTVSCPQVAVVPRWHCQLSPGCSPRWHLPGGIPRWHPQVAPLVSCPQAAPPSVVPRRQVVPRRHPLSRGGIPTRGTPSAVPRRHTVRGTPSVVPRRHPPGGIPRRHQAGSCPRVSCHQAAVVPVSCPLSPSVVRQLSLIPSPGGILERVARCSVVPRWHPGKSGRAVSCPQVAVVPRWHHQVALSVVPRRLPRQLSPGGSCPRQFPRWHPVSCPQVAPGGIPTRGTPSGPRQLSPGRGAAPRQLSPGGTTRQVALSVVPRRLLSPGGSPRRHLPGGIPRWHPQVAPRQLSPGGLHIPRRPTRGTPSVVPRRHPPGGIPRRHQAAVVPVSCPLVDLWPRVSAQYASQSPGLLAAGQSALLLICAILLAARAAVAVQLAAACKPVAVQLAAVQLAAVRPAVVARRKSTRTVGLPVPAAGPAPGSRRYTADRSAADFRATSRPARSVRRRGGQPAGDADRPDHVGGWHQLGPGFDRPDHH